MEPGRAADILRADFSAAARGISKHELVRYVPRESRSERGALLRKSVPDHFSANSAGIALIGLTWTSR